MYKSEGPSLGVWVALLVALCILAAMAALLYPLLPYLIRS